MDATLLRAKLKTQLAAGLPVDVSEVELLLAWDREHPAEKAASFVLEHKLSLHLESAFELLSAPEPALEWMIEGLWTDKSRGLIAGNPGVGKTWLALDMLLSVVSGQPCLGRFAPAFKAPVLLVEEEASHLNLSRRLHALARARGLSAGDLSNLFHITRQFPKIPRHTDDLILLIKTYGIRLVVFDSLRRFHGCDENSSEQMQPVLDAFSRIGIETGCSVVLIHHLAKQSGDKGSKKPIFERLRGTSDLWAWRDCIIGCEGDEDALRSTLSFQFRDAESPPPLSVVRSVNPSSGVISLSATEITESEEFMERSAVAVSFVAAKFGGAFLSDIARGMGGRKAENLRLLKAMVKKGILVEALGGKFEVPV